MKTNLLVQWRESLATCATGDGAPGRVGADHSVFHRAETADACLVDRNWMPFGVVGNIHVAASPGRASCIEYVAALGSRIRLAQHAVDQASGCLARMARTSCATQRDQIGCKSYRRVGGRIAYLRGLDGTNGAHGRRLIG